MQYNSIGIRVQSPVNVYSDNRNINTSTTYLQLQEVRSVPLQSQNILLTAAAFPGITSIIFY
jgi:hypothetical protein